MADGASEPFIPTLDVAEVNAFAVSDDGKAVFARCVAVSGATFLLQVATDRVDALTAALTKAKAIADEKREGRDNVGAMHVPHHWDVAVTPDYDGVIVILDRGTPTEAMIGLDTKSAGEMGRGLRTQARAAAARRPGFILPGQEIVV